MNPIPQNLICLIVSSFTSLSLVCVFFWNLLYSILSVLFLVPAD